MTARPMEEERLELVREMRAYHADMVADDGGECRATAMYREAADALESLSAEVKGLREALKTISEDGLWDAANPNALKSIQGISRAALSPIPTQVDK